VLTAEELSPATAGHAGANPAILKAQDDIRDADALTLIYPLWWLSMPAMMKGYVEPGFLRVALPMSPGMASYMDCFPARNPF